MKIRQKHHAISSNQMRQKRKNHEIPPRKNHEKSPKESTKNDFSESMEQKTYSAAAAARKLGVSIPTLKQMAASGELETFRTPGGHLRVMLGGLGPSEQGNRHFPQRSEQPSTVLTNRRERVEELGLEAQELRAKREIAKLRAEEEAEAQRRREEIEAREREAERQRDAEERERERWKLQQAELRERRELQRQTAEFHSRWIKKATEILSDAELSWLTVQQRNEVQKAVEKEIRDRQPEDECCMSEVVMTTITAATTVWAEERKWVERVQQAAQRAVRSLPYDAADSERARANTTIREALQSLHADAEDFELRAAADEAIRPIRYGIEKRNLIERLVSWAVLQLPWSRTDADKRRVRRECAEILQELADDVSEEEAKDALEGTIEEATEQIEEREAREERKRRKAELIQQGIAEVSSYLYELKRDGVISSQELWDFNFQSDLEEAVKEALNDELMGKETSNEAKKLVHEIIDSELE